ncbi:MAG: hypothetical protein IJE50_01830 [Clostridia bacterium]|nr:hypothetical protein [Clostridia bacterium]
MTKSTKTLIVILLATLLCLSLVACEQPIVYQVTFGSGQAQSVEKDGSITAPDYTTTDPLQSFLGWATEEGKTSASDVLFAKGATISYEKLGEYAVEDQVKFYPVISTKKSIALTIKGTTDKTATLIEGDSTSVQAPEVEVGAKQEFLGWANAQNATTVQIAKDGIINYESAHALATDGSLTLYPVYKTYDLVVGVVNVKFSLEDAEGEIIHDVHYYVGLVKADFSALYPEVDVLYRVYEGDVNECGAAITADGDVDVVLAGNNIDDPEKGNVAILAKAKLAEKYNPDGSRRGALVVNSKQALDMYAMVIGSENKDIAITLGENTTTVNKALGNKVDVSGITDPSGRVLLGFAREATATTPEIVGSKLGYAEVEEFAVDGAITLYPVWGEFDLIVAVWGQNGTNEYVSVEQLAEIEAGFRAFLAEKGITDAVMRFDRVEGKTAEYPANIATDVLVILSGKNVESQTGATGKHQCINITTTSTRYAGVFTERVKSAQQSFVDLFIEFVAEDTVEVTLGTAKTTVSALKGNEVDVSAIEIPAGKKIAGFATTEGATEAQIAGTVIDYKAVVDLATDGAITLYPVFEDAFIKYDLIVAIWGQNGSNEYASQAQIDKIEADFVAFLETKGITNAVVRFDLVSGSSKESNATYYPTQVPTDAMIILGGKNVLTQCTSTTGGHQCVNLETTSARYVAVYQDRVPAESQTLVDLFVEFAAGVTAE